MDESPTGMHGSSAGPGYSKNPRLSQVSVGRDSGGRGTGRHRHVSSRTKSTPVPTRGDGRAFGDKLWGPAVVEDQGGDGAGWNPGMV